MMQEGQTNGGSFKRGQSSWNAGKSKPRHCVVCQSVLPAKFQGILCSEECRRKYRPQTFKDCAHCGKRFGPVDHLSKKFCSYACKVAAQTLSPSDRLPRAKRTPEAQRAQRHVHYLISIGRMVRPETCENCGDSGKIEAAHYDYAEPTLVRWLCRSCHVRWDKKSPKGGVYGRSDRFMRRLGAQDALKEEAHAGT